MVLEIGPSQVDILPLDPLSRLLRRDHLGDAADSSSQVGRIDGKEEERLGDGKHLQPRDDLKKRPPTDDPSSDCIICYCLFLCRRFILQQPIERSSFSFVKANLSIRENLS